METQSKPLFTQRTSKHNLWQQRITACEASGLSHKAWCQREGVPLSGLYYWRKKFRRVMNSERHRTTKSNHRFVPITITTSTPAMILRMGSSLCIDIAPDIERSLLKDLLSVLRETV